MENSIYDENFPTVSGGDAFIEEPVEDTPVEPITSEQLYDVVYNAVYDANVAQIVTDGQSISNSAIEYFKGVLMNESPFIDYVCYVGQPYQYWNYNYEQTGYEYCMAFGDLDLNGTTFSGVADVVTMRTNGEQWVSYQNEQYVSINAPLYYSRSNLGDYSGIVQKDYVGIGVLMLLAIGGVTWCVKKFLSGS